MPLAMPAEVTTRSSTTYSTSRTTRRPRVAPGQLVLQVVVGGAAAAVEQPGPAERVGAGADAGHGAAGGVVRAAAGRACPAPSGPVPRSVGDRQPGTTTRSSGVELGPVGRRAAAAAPCAVGTSSCSAT